MDVLWARSDVIDVMNMIFDGTFRINVGLTTL